MVWSPWFGYKSADGGGRGTSGQRAGQGQITEGHVGMPKNWTLRLGLTGPLQGSRAGQGHSQISILDASFRPPGKGLRVSR